METDAAKFKKNLIALLELFQEIIVYIKTEKPFYKLDIEPNILSLAKFKLSSMDDLILIENFISKSYNYWDQIKEKDEEFLVQNSNVLFEGAPVEYINIFTEILTKCDDNNTPLIDNDIKDNIWEILNGLVINSIKHIHIQRKYNTTTKKYTVIYAKDIKLGEVSEKWNVKLKKE